MHFNSNVKHKPLCTWLTTFKPNTVYIGTLSLFTRVSELIIKFQINAIYVKGKTVTYNQCFGTY